MDSIFLKLLKTNIEKMSVFRFSTMFMKPKELSHFSTMLMKGKRVIGNERDEWRVTCDEMRNPMPGVRRGRNRQGAILRCCSG